MQPDSSGQMAQARRAREVFQEFLLKDERIVWAGQPDLSAIFTRADLFLVPFSLLWGAFALFWEVMAVLSGAPFFFVLWGIPFAALGAYITVGRFFYKAWRKARTWYALTNQRALRLTRTSGTHLSAVYLDRLAGLELHESAGGRGAVTFGSGAPTFIALENTGLEFLVRRYGEQPLVFHDLRDARTVYELANDLRRE